VKLRAIVCDRAFEFANKMKDAENASHEGKKKHEMLWPVFQITHQRTYALS
jgi:bud site selection protein 31